MADALPLPLRSQRLTYRALTEDDFEVHQRLFSDPEVVRYLFDEVLDEERVRAHLVRRLWRGLGTAGEWANLAVCHGGRVIGEIGIELTSEVHFSCEIGYVFVPGVQGQGFATEAARVAVDVAMTFHRAHRVLARLDARNLDSARLLTRLGMRQEGHFRENEFVKGEWTDEVVFAVLSNEWAVTTDFS